MMINDISISPQIETIITVESSNSLARVERVETGAWTRVSEVVTYADDLIQMSKCPLQLLTLIGAEAKEYGVVDPFESREFSIRPVLSRCSWFLNLYSIKVTYLTFDLRLKSMNFVLQILISPAWSLHLLFFYLPV